MKAKTKRHLVLIDVLTVLLISFCRELKATDYMMKADSIAGNAVDAVKVFKKVNGDWERIRWVRVEYHVSLGLLKVHLSYADGKAGMEEIHFDPDTGRLLN
jgi:hypothetical protein